MRAALPHQHACMPDANHDLPVQDALPALLEALRGGANAVLVAPPGAGKTTLTPLALLDAPWLAGRRIVMTEPRRLAARAAATRMASLLGEPVGGRVGYRTRLESRVSAATRIEVVTAGLLVRRLLADPGLAGVGCVILDEVHERSLDGDLVAAFCLDLQRSFGHDLRLVLMSATPEGARLARLFDAPVIESLGRIFPVEIRHAKRDVADARALPEAMASAIRGVMAEAAGDVLAFLPGMAEIRRTERLLEGGQASVLPLHGDMALAEQDRALTPAAGRRIVLATSIAETSLTVPGVRIVVDGGFRRSPRLDSSSGLPRLTTVRISRAAAEQRGGRSGREAPGLALRLWTLALGRGLAPFDPPEIRHAELAGLALDCLAWGTPASALPFLDAPPAGALAAAEALLAELGAIKNGQVTELGRRMVRLGAHPRLSAMMLAAETPDEAALAADLAALLEERDPMRLAAADASLASRLEAIALGHPQADRAALSRIRTGASAYRRRLDTSAAPAGDPARLLAAGFPDRIAQRRGEPGAFRLAGGGSAKLPPDDPLARVPLLAIASLEQKTSARIRLAAPLDPDRLPPAIAARVTVSIEGNLDPQSGSVLARRRRRLGALVLEDRMVPADAEHAAAALAALAARDLALLPWSDGTRQLQARAALLRQLDPTAPDLSDEALAATTPAWLAPHLPGMTKLADLKTLDLRALLLDHLGWAAAQRLEQDLPTQLALPGGRAPIDYAGPVPTASARAQAFYGLRTTPLLAGGRLKLQLALLSPAGRPIALTSDLRGFWAGAWSEVRKEMRGRYPKHDWPEKP